MSNAHNENRLVLTALDKLTTAATYDDAKTLRRAARTIHTWSEHECNGVIQRDEDTLIPYWHSSYDGKRIYKARDLEKGAIARIKAVCDRLGLHYYIQGDPRGGTLYVDTAPIPDNNYNRATFIA